MSSETGQWSPSDYASEYQMLVFVFSQLASRLATATLVQVVACTNSGGVSAVGTVDVQPLVNQMTGAREPVPHGVLYKLPYFRLQGGVNAVILDPEPGNIGIAVFASRDISAVKSTKAQANPGSARQFDMSDGLYIGGVLNGVPTRYVQFTDTGISLIAPDEITIQAPTVNIAGSTAVNISGGNTSIDGKVFLSHEHSGVQSGGSNTGGVV